MSRAVGLVTNLHLFGRDLAISTAALGHNHELGALLAQLFLVDESDRSIVICFVITVVDRDSNSVLFLDTIFCAGTSTALVETDPETVVDACLVRSNLDMQVKSLFTVNSEVVQIVLSSRWNGDRPAVQFVVVLHDLLALHQIQSTVKITHLAFQKALLLLPSFNFVHHLVSVISQSSANHIMVSFLLSPGLRDTTFDLVKIMLDSADLTGHAALRTHELPNALLNAFYLLG